MAKTPAPPELLATAAAARILGTTPHTVRVARRNGELIPEVVSTSGICLFTREEIDRYVAAREKRRALAKSYAEKRRALAKSCAEGR